MTDRTAAQERAAIVTFMRQVIGDGYPSWHEHKGKCVHGTYAHEDCIACYDEHLSTALDAIESGLHLQAQEKPDDQG